MQGTITMSHDFIKKHTCVTLGCTLRDRLNRILFHTLLLMADGRILWHAKGILREMYF
jgi:hypothetical protein